MKCLFDNQAARWEVGPSGPATPGGNPPRTIRREPDGNARVPRGAPRASSGEEPHEGRFTGNSGSDRIAQRYPEAQEGPFSSESGRTEVRGGRQAEASAMAIR